MADDTSELPEAASPGAACPHCGAPLPASILWCAACGKGAVEHPAQADLDVEMLALRAWRIYQREMGRIMLAVWTPLVVCLLACLIGAIGVGMVMEVAERSMRRGVLGDINPDVRDFLLAAQAFGLLTLIVCGATSVILPALVRCLLDCVQGKPAAVPNRILGRYLLRAFASSLLVMLLGPLALAACFGAAGGLMMLMSSNPPADALLGFLGAGMVMAGCGLPILLALTLWPYLWVLVDRDPPGVTCVRQAAAMTRGSRMMVGIVIAFAGVVALAGVAALGVGVLIAVPYLALLATVTYCELAGHRIPDE
jgi:hypothetical protein